MGRKTTHSLSRQLDQEVYAAVTTFVHTNTFPRIGMADIYQYIKTSNSSLARKPKPALEASIERVWEDLKQDIPESYQSSDSEQAFDNTGNAPNSSRGNDTGHRLNRHMTESWGFKTDRKTLPLTETNSTGTAVNVEAAKRPPPSPSLDAHSSLPQPNQRLRKRPRSDYQASSASSLQPSPNIRFRDLGGIDHIIERAAEIVHPLIDPTYYTAGGIKPAHGILFHGPPGCGKTRVCEAIAGELELPFFPISAPSIVSGMSGESEKVLRGHFRRAIEAAPCVMFIDEIDAITTKRETAAREMEKRIVSQFGTCMDDLDLEKTGGKPVLVLATTNRPDSLDPSLRRPGRFEVEISVGMPDERARAQILRAKTRKMKLNPEVDLDALAKSTPGFVGADLESLVSVATKVKIKRHLDALEHLDWQGSISPSFDMNPFILNNSLPALNSAHTNNTTGPDNSSADTPAIQRFHRSRQMMIAQAGRLPAIDGITQSDFLAALPKIQPSAMREGFATVPSVSFNSVGALEAHRSTLRSAIITPILHPERYRSLGVNHPTGVLLYGPPGCGKTLLARAVAHESKANFIMVKGPELMNKYVGESEREVRRLFQRARQSQPVVVFFDEFDALSPRRGGGGASAEGEAAGSAVSEASARVVNALLIELDGFAREASENSVYVIAASNNPQAIDPAILRAGRLERHLYVPLPSAEERGMVARTILKRKPVNEQTSELIVRYVEEKCARFSGADLEGLVRSACMLVIERDGASLELQDIVDAVEKGHAKATVTVAEVKRWERMQL